MSRRLAPFVADLIQFVELLWQFAVGNVELQHKGGRLLLSWSSLDPLLMLALYVLASGNIFDGTFGHSNETRPDRVLTIFLGLTLFHCASESLVTSPTVIVSSPNRRLKPAFADVI